MLLQETVALVIFGWLIGAVLGTRFRVFSLLPAAAFGTVAIAITAFTRDQSLLSTLLAMIFFILSLELGYLSAVGMRYLADICRNALRRWWGT
jgi:hypothetical protein